MKRLSLLVGFIFVFGSCFGRQLSQQEIHKIGRWIFFNETSGKEELMIFWNTHEDFPSFGIGHCIWHLKDQEPVHEEQFPALCTYLKKHGVKLPAWLNSALLKGAPWKNREAFLKDTKRSAELLEILKETIDLQARFMVERVHQKLPEIIAAAPDEYRKKLQSHCALLEQTSMGTYALVDYLNFKGSGLNHLADGRRQYWGLLQVLLGIPEHVTKETILKAFTISAAKVLMRRVEESAPDYKLLKFFNGWMKRVSTYSDVLLLW